MASGGHDFARCPGLDGMAAINSGGASGIGEAILRACAAEGVGVGVVDPAEPEDIARMGAVFRFGRLENVFRRNFVVGG